MVINSMRKSLIIVFYIFLCSCSELPGFSDATIQWGTDLEQGLTKAKSENKLLLVDFYAKWCPQCKKMARVTYSDNRVITRLKQYVCVRIDIDKEPEIADSYDGSARRYGGSGVPTTIIMDAFSNEIFREHGYIKPEDLLLVFDDLSSENS